MTRLPDPSAPLSGEAAAIAFDLLFYINHIFQILQRVLYVEWEQKVMNLH